MKSVVSIVKGNDVDVMAQEAIDLIGGIESVVKPGDVVLIKPNCHGPHPPEDHITTDSHLIVAVAKICQKAKAKEVLIGEASSLGNAMLSFEVSGIKDAVEAAGAGRLVDLEKDEYVSMKVPDGKILKKIDRPKTLASCDVLISMPVIKTHHGTKMTGALKNMMGTLNRAGKDFVHAVGLYESIADINKARKPDLVIADMIVAMEGMGPIAGRTVEELPDGSRAVQEIVGGVLVPLDMVIASTDPVASDATCARIIKLDPEEVLHIRYSYEHGLGNIKADQIEVRGKQIEEVARAFQLCPTNLDDFSEYVTVHAENACFGCLAYQYWALENLRCRGMLQPNSGLHIVMGPKDEIPDEWGTDKNLLLLGNCLSKWKHLGMYGEGCPPTGRPFLLGPALRTTDPDAMRELRKLMIEYPPKK